MNGGLEDSELVRAALTGDLASFGSLVERHHGGMRVVAVAMLGFGPDADDVVQDAIVTALCRLGDLRDPNAVGPWLRSIVRNACLMRLRRAGREQSLPAGDGGRLTCPPPEHLVERQATADTVWSAIEGLSEPLQLTVLLRYFSGVSSYEQIAAISGVPIGTVRSRLSEARRHLRNRILGMGAVLEAADNRRQQRADDLLGLLGSAPQGRFPAVLLDLAHPDLLLVGPQGQRGIGLDLPVLIMDSDLQAGVRQRPFAVASSSRFTIVECELISPPWDPEHCPPAVAWLVSWESGRIDAIRLFHPQPVLAQ